MRGNRWAASIWSKVVSNRYGVKLVISVGDSEDEVFWKVFMTSLKQRGLAVGL